MNYRLCLSLSSGLIRWFWLDCTGCFFSTDVGELRSYENPKNKITAVPATEEEIWGAKYMVFTTLTCYSLVIILLYLQNTNSEWITSVKAMILGRESFFFLATKHLLCLVIL